MPGNGRTHFLSHGGKYYGNGSTAQHVRNECEQKFRCYNRNAGKIIREVQVTRLTVQQMMQQDFLFLRR